LQSNDDSINPPRRLPFGSVSLHDVMALHLFRDLEGLKARADRTDRSPISRTAWTTLRASSPLGHVIAAGDVSCSACPEPLWDAIDRLLAERAAGDAALPKTRYFSQPGGGYGSAS